jgi:hypothetical protein
MNSKIAVLKMTAKILGLVASLGVFGGLALTAPAQAGTITIFKGQDNGALPGGSQANSDAARASFLADASGYGTVDTHGFGHQAVGASSGTWLNGDGHWAITGSCCTPSYSGVTDTQTGSATDGFHAYGSINWLGLVNGSVTFYNTSPTNSIGAYFTGLTTGSYLTISFNDGTPENLKIPVTASGGVEFVGLTDTTTFSSFTITDIPTNIYPLGKNFGIDGISFNGLNGVDAVPEASTWAMMLIGFAGIGFVACRRKKNVLSLAVA